MDERKNKMTDQRYREILPMAYMTAAIEKGRQPRPVEVGLCARAIVDAEDENNLAYRVAMATKIHCTIVGVKRVSTKTGYDKYEITYRTFGKDEDETIPSPLIVVVKHFCNTLFENSPGISSFKWCFPIIVGMRTDMIVPYVHISV